MSDPFAARFIVYLNENGMYTEFEDLMRRDPTYILEALTLFVRYDDEQKKIPPEDRW